MKNLGVSAYIAHMDDLSYLEKSRQEGVTKIFISLHIPEEINSEYKNNSISLINTIKKMGFKHIICDISKLGIKALGMATTNLDWLYNQGIECRLDYGFTKVEIAKLSIKYKIWINASTTSKEILDELLTNGNIKNVNASHDFYPLIGTGLSPEQLISQDRLLRKYKIKKIISFIPGVDKFRGPMHDGLPTLENCRYDNPLDSLNRMIETYGHDGVYIGDPDFPKFSPSVNSVTKIKDTHNLLTKNKYELRISNSLFRFKGTRIMSHSESGKSSATISSVKPKKSTIKIGDIVMLNSNSKRYEGEICVVVSNIPKAKWNMFNKIGELIDPTRDIPKIGKNKVIKIKRA